MENNKCPQCGFELFEGVTNCSRCGYKVEKLSDPLGLMRDHEENKAVMKEEDPMLFYHVDKKRFIVLSIITLGFWNAYWFYKNFLAVQIEMKKRNVKVYDPFWKAVFNIFFCFGLFKKIEQSAKIRGLQEKFDYKVVAWIYFFLIFASNSFDRAGSGEKVNWGVVLISMLLSWGVIFPLLKVRDVIEFNNKSLGEDVNQKKVATWQEKAMIAVGVVLLLMALGSLFTA